MTGYDASVLNNPETRILIVAPNWLGDGIMAMPAVQELKRRLHPQAEITMAARPGQVGLWNMQPAVSKVIPLATKTREMLRTSKRLKKYRFTAVIILPHSFRSALICRMAGIPCRRGTIFQAGRNLLINDAVSLRDMENKHQQWEISRLILPQPQPETLPPPEIIPSEEAAEKALAQLKNQPRPILACIPGAARGPSKQWPGERFQAVAKEWIAQTGGSVCWLGTPADESLCEGLNAPLGTKGISLAGKTTLQEFTALLQQVDQALVNDSGGMHLAAAVGTPLVAIFGNTDPVKTGPLSDQACILQKSEWKNRSIGRHSDAALDALAKVTVDEVIEPTLAKHLPLRKGIL